MQQRRAGQCSPLVAAVSLPSVDSIAVFTVLMCFVSSMFAAGKCIWMVALLKIYGPVNFQQAVHATLPAYGLAGFLGPYTLNAALQQTDVLSDQPLAGRHEWRAGAVLRAVPGDPAGGLRPVGRGPGAAVRDGVRVSGGS